MERVRQAAQTTNGPLPPVTFFCFPPVPMTTPASPPAGPPFGIDDALDQAERALGLTPAVGGR